MQLDDPADYALGSAQECSKKIEEASTEITKVAASLAEAARLLNSEDYSAVVIDQCLSEATPDDSDRFLQHLGTAIPVHVSFAISKSERVVRHVRVALQRRKCEGLIARQAAESSLRSELNGAVTAMLLSCELALQVPDLPAPAQDKRRTVHECAHAPGPHGIASFPSPRNLRRNLVKHSFVQDLALSKRKTVRNLSAPSDYQTRIVRQVWKAI